jgi:predicted regulator of Ras-like GTPase activity (Roadblock/LC7/MglB family)
MSTGNRPKPEEEALMNEGVQGAFAEMLDVSTDIDKALLFSPAGILASNMPEETQATARAQAEELTRLGQAQGAAMGSQPFTQLVVETPGGYVFLARESYADGMTIVATGKKGSRIGLALYDLRTCMRDVRETMKAKAPEEQGTEEA